MERKILNHVIAMLKENKLTALQIECETALRAMDYLEAKGYPSMASTVVEACFADVPGDFVSGVPGC